MRAIDADALKQEFPKDTDWEYPVNSNSYVCAIIDSQLTIEPERKTGKWIVHYECPKCGEIIKNFAESCPFCGADMIGDQNE